MSTQWKCYKKVFRDTWIRSLKSDTNLLISDTMTPGLHLRYYATTRNIVFYLGYMVKVTKRRRNIQIGRYGDFNIAQIRELAIELRQQIASGLDPMFEREKESKKIEEEISSRIKVKDLLETYFEKQSKTHKSIGTQKTDRSKIDQYLKPILGDYWIKDLDLPKLMDFYEQVAKKTSFGNANRAMQVLSAFWNWCELKGHLSINTNPCKLVPKGKNEKKKHKRLTLDEYKRLIAAMDAGLTDSQYNPRMFRALKVITFTGCRPTEITGLKKTEIDFQNRFIEFETKNKNDEGRHPLPLPAIEELRIALEECPEDSERVFPATRGTEKSLLDLRKAFVWAVNRAGLPKMEIYDLRRSFITMGTDTLGLPIQQVSAGIGHSEVSTTEIYSKISDLTRRNTLDQIATAIAG